MMASVTTRRVQRQIGRAAVAAVAVLMLAPLAWSDAIPTTCDGTTRDDYGYTCTLENFAAPGEAIIPDISASGRRVARWTFGNADNGYFTTTLGTGNVFTFYGDVRSTIFIGSNGYVTFGSGNGQTVPILEPPSTAAPNNVIYAYGDDLTVPALPSAVYYNTAPCNGGDSCFVINWKGVTAVGLDVTVDARLALDFTNGKIYTEVISETGGDTDITPFVIGIENQTGSTGLWFSPSGFDSSEATTGYRFTYEVQPLPGDTAVTVTATDVGNTIEFVPSTMDNYAGTIVVRRIGSDVVATPQNGTTYTVGQPLGNGTVVCTTDGNSCEDTTTTFIDTDYHYAVFAFDDAGNYAAPVNLTARSKSSGVQKFALSVGGATLNPPEVYGTASGTVGIVEAGSDKLVHNIGENGLWIPGWVPPALGDVIQARPTTLDINAGVGSPDWQGYFPGLDGFLYRQSLTDPQALISRNVDGPLPNDSGCTGFLVTTPKVALTAYGASADRVLLATRCGASNNKIMSYDLGLSTFDAYPNPATDPGVALGIASGAGALIYRAGLPSLYIQPVRNNGTNQPSLVTLEINPDGTFVHPAHAINNNLANIDADAQLVRRGPGFWVAVGNTAGRIYVLDPLGAALHQPLPIKASFVPPVSSPVIGLGVTGSAAVNGQIENWVVWTTSDNLIHGIKLGGDGAFVPATYWEHAVTSPSAPLVLSGFDRGFYYTAFVGSGDGNVYAFDATNATPTPYHRQVLASPGALSQPTFDFNDGTNQGLVVGAADGTLHWLVLPIYSN